MTEEIAIKWLEGKLSMINTVPPEPRDTWELRIEQLDTLKIQQAYYVLKYYRELAK